LRDGAGQGLRELVGVVGGVVTAVAVFRGVFQHLVADGKANRVGAQVLLGKARVVVALAGGVIASLAHVDVVAELGEVVEVKRVAFACATAAVGLLAVGVGLAERRMPPVPIRQAAVRVIGIVAREG